MTRVALIHTVSSLVPVFKRLTDELMPGVETFNIVDESLLMNTIRDGHLQPETMRRAIGYMASAEEAGADAILVTCSSIGPAVDAAQGLTRRPLLRVDLAMADEAVRIGGRIGVLATLRTTLEPTTELIRARAMAKGVTVDLASAVCEGAFEAATSGDLERHDKVVREALRGLIARVDVVVLAQASMARVADSLPDTERTVPILSSPRLGVARLAELLEGLEPQAMPVAPHM